MAKQQKYYVVWKGVTPGIYDSWTECQLQIKNYKGAVYKSFPTREEAEVAFNSPAHAYLTRGDSLKVRPEEQKIPENFDLNCLAVDAACSGNPGPMEYRGVYLLTGQEVFHFGPVYGTNNIGEFLAIVHGLALMKQSVGLTGGQRVPFTAVLLLQGSSLVCQPYSRCLRQSCRIPPTQKVIPL